MERHLTRTAVFVLLERDEQVFLLRRANTGWADGYLTIPAGHVDKGSSVKEAAITEAKEEACVDIAPEDLRLIHVDYIKDKYVNFYFKAEHWEGEPAIGEPELASEGRWVPKHELPEDIIPQLKNMFACLDTGIIFSEFASDFTL